VVKYVLIITNYVLDESFGKFFVFNLLNYNQFL
jgi:hypothetical protein